MQRKSGFSVMKAVYRERGSCSLFVQSCSLNITYKLLFESCQYIFVTYDIGNILTFLSETKKPGELKGGKKEDMAGFDRTERYVEQA
jgi:hypothetical protein